MNISKVILHILDNNHQAPILSIKEIDVEIEIQGFLEKHIMRAVNEGDIKKAYLTSGEVHNSCNKLAGNEDSFVEVSHELSNRLFGIMKANPSIPAADLAFVLFKEEERQYLAILKLNYKSSYIHYISNTDEGTFNQLIKQKTTLPNETQKVDECIIINLANTELKILEKK